MKPKDPSGSAGSTDLELGGGDVPDLDLGPRSKPSQQSIALASMRPGVPMTPASVPPSHRPADPAEMGGAFDLDFGANGGTAPAPNASPAPVAAPGRGASSTGALQKDDDGGYAEAVRLGDYGPAPAEWWKSPFYAYRVKMRQMELRKDLHSKRGELQEAEDAVEDVLVGMAERGRKKVELKSSYAKLLSMVHSAEGALRQRDSAMAAEAEAHAKATGVIDDKLAPVEAELAGARGEEKSLSDVFEKVDAIRQRADAKVKRVDIDLRAAIARAAAANAGAGRKSQPDVGAAGAEVQARTAERDARQAEVDAAMPAVTEAAQRLTAARKKSAGIEQRVLGLKNERAALDAQFRRRGAAHGRQVALAQKEVRTAMATLGRAMAVDTATFGSDWDGPRADVATLDRAVKVKDDEVMLHVMALDAHESSTVSRGIGVAIGSVVFMLLLVIVPVVLNVMHNLRPPPPPPSVADAPE